MSTVIMHSVVSVDGFIADEKDEVGPLFDWYGNGDVPIVEGSSMKISPISAGYVQPMWASVRSMVIGRHLFDITNGWEGTPPTGDHVVVVSHRGRPAGWHPATSAGRRSRSAWWTRWRWTSCPWSSARASGTSARSLASTCSGTQTR